MNNSQFTREKSAECFVNTKDKGVDDDSRYRGANQKAESHIDGEVWCKGHGDSKQSLKSDGQQEDEASAVPYTERGTEMSLHEINYQT